MPMCKPAGVSASDLTIHTDLTTTTPPSNRARWCHDARKPGPHGRVPLQDLGVGIGAAMVAGETSAAHHGNCQR
jgi:hypothetical protein